MLTTIAEHMSIYDGPITMTRRYANSWKDEDTLLQSNYLPYKMNAYLEYAVVFKFRYGEWMRNIFQWNGQCYLGATNIFKYRKYNGKWEIKDCVKFINEHVDDPKLLYRGTTNTKFNLFYKYFRGKD